MSVASLHDLEREALRIFRNRVSATPDDVVAQRLDLLRGQGRVERHSLRCLEHIQPLWAPQGNVDERFINSAQALVGNKKFEEILRKFGGFWWQGVKSLKPALEGRWDIKGALKALGVEPWGDFTVESYFDFQATVEHLLDSCPHFSERTCLVCLAPFKPSYLTIVDLKVGDQICTKCCLVASGETDARAWLDPDKERRLSEISLGLQLASEENQKISIGSDNPLSDSSDALRRAELINSDFESTLRGFLAVALRPKYRQVVSDFESWPAWTATLVGSQAQTFPTSQRLLVAMDGHRCFSQGELGICNFLNSRGISHRREVLYSDFPNANSLVWGIADFVVGSVAIEFAGLIEYSDYSRRLEAKVSAARESDIEVIVVRPSDLVNLATVLGKLLPKD